MTIIEHTGILILSSALILVSWFAYLLLNEYLDKLREGLLQEILGTVITFGLFMLVGVILYFFSYSFFMGWFLIIITLLIYRGMHKLFRRFYRNGDKPGIVKPGMR